MHHVEAFTKREGLIRPVLNNTDLHHEPGSAFSWSEDCTPYCSNVSFKEETQIATEHFHAQGESIKR